MDSLAVQGAAVPFVTAAPLEEICRSSSPTRKLFVFTTESHVPATVTRLPFQRIITFAEKHLAGCAQEALRLGIVHAAFIILAGDAPIAIALHFAVVHDFLRDGSFFLTHFQLTAFHVLTR